MNQGKLSKRRALLLAFAALFVVVGVGCGGGGDSGGSSGAVSSQTSSQAANQGAGGEAAEGEGNGGSEGGAAEAGKAGNGAGGQSPLLAEADAICTKSGEEYRQNATKYFSLEVKGRKEEEEIYEEIVEQVTVPTIESRVEALQALSGSASEEEAIDEVVVKLEAMGDAAEAETIAFAEGPIPAVIDARETSKELGLKNCGLLG